MRREVRGERAALRDGGRDTVGIRVDCKTLHVKVVSALVV